MQYSIVGNEDGSYVTVFVPGSAPLVAAQDHPNFERICEGVKTGDESVYELFDIAAAVATKFNRLSERVTVANGRVYFDGDEVNNVLTNQVVRFLDEGVDDWEPLVYFFENVQDNPQEHSREQLYAWLAGRDFTITVDGMIVGYKGVRKLDDGTFTSINTGTAIVDGEVKTGAIPNYAGAVVEMPRAQVEWDPANGCSTGLHVGTYDYANGFGQGALLEVHVNPRDVVSVPTDSYEQKMRVCRYIVVDTIDQPYSEAVLTYEDDEFEEDDPYSSGDEECDCGYESCCGDPGCCCNGAGGPPSDEDELDFDVEW